MPEIELVFSSRPFQGSSVGDAPMPGESFSLFFSLHDTPIARRYFEALRPYDRALNAIGEPDRTYNFPGDRRDRQWIADQLNRCIDVINAYSPGLVTHRAKSQMDQELMNHLHHYFERYRGPIIDPPRFFQEAPPEVRQALEDFNILIHRYEDYCRNEEYEAQGRSSPKIVVTFKDRKRFPLEDADYAHFSRRVVWGRWYINYCEVGKPIWDLYQDRDEVVGEENILPLRYYSADALVEFSPSITEEDAARQLEALHRWWSEHRDLMDSLGFTKGDPKNAIGDIPVADLNRRRGSIRGRSEQEILQRIGQHPCILGVILHD